MPTPYLQVEGLEKAFGADLLFSDLSLVVNRGDKVGLIAQNGKGKSTLLRILAGEEDYQKGSITYARDLKVGYLSQVPVFSPDVPVLQAVMPPRADDDWTAEDYGKYAVEQLIPAIGENVFRAIGR